MNDNNPTDAALEALWTRPLDWSDYQATINVIERIAVLRENGGYDFVLARDLELLQRRVEALVKNRAPLEPEGDA